MGVKGRTSAIEVNGKAAFRIQAELKHETDKAYLLNCEGDEKWIPKGVCRFNPATNTVDIQDWWYGKNFPNG